MLIFGTPMITVLDLRSDLPTQSIRNDPLLVLVDNAIYCSTNTYLPNWEVLSYASQYQPLNHRGWMLLSEAIQYARRDLPVTLEDSGGCCNVVLVKRKSPQEWATTPWDISNTAYYRAHSEEFECWVELEFVPTPQFE